MKKRKLKFNLYDFIIRYSFLVLVAIPNLWIFYTIFTPLTIYPVYLITKIFFNVSLSSNVILINGHIPIDMINACIAGSAYYLLLVLNISIPKIETKERVKMILFSFLLFLIVNIIRIVILILIYMSSNSSFNLIHQLFWYGLSTLFVLLIWFLEIKIFKVKDIPVYSDIKSLIKFIKK
ncbi:MAG: pacearchaeosortase [Candidatus Nanoarchaeia archaeon]